MAIKVRPFKTKVDEVSVEGKIEDLNLVCLFWELVPCYVPVTSIGSDESGGFAIVEQTEIKVSDGFIFSIEPEFDELVGGQWGCRISLRRREDSEVVFLHDALKQQGVDPETVNLIIPPKQSVDVYLDPNGNPEGSGRLEPAESGPLLLEIVRMAANNRILFLPHAVNQMSRPDRMITTAEVHRVIETGEAIENYVDDVRGHSCLILGYGTGNRPIHIVCSPKADFLAIITAYLPDENEWSDDFRMRIRR